MPSFKIPLTIGVTGHRQISADCTAAIEAAVISLLDRVRKSAPDTPIVLLTGLAEGADRMVARLARDCAGAELIVVLPRPAESYRDDFATAESKAEFDGLLATARLVVTCPTVTSDPTVGYAWAGNFTALHAHLLIALWDGEEPRGQGGTASVVAAKLKGRYPGFNDADPLQYDEGGAVAHVVTTRAGEAPASGAGEVRWLFPEAVTIGAQSGEHRHAAVLSALDALNRLLKRDGRAREAWTTDQLSPTVSALQQAADRFAGRFQQRTNHAVRILVLATIAAAISSALGTTLFTTATIALGFAVWICTTLSRWQRRHTDLRGLAEAGRIQHAWIVSGLQLCVADHYHPAQAASVAWIRRAVRTAVLLDDVQKPRPPLTPGQRNHHAEAGYAWIDEQVAYFVGKGGVVPRYRRQARHFAILGFACLGIGLLLLGGNTLLDAAHVRQTLFDTAPLLQVGRIALAITAAVQAYQAFMSFGDLQRSFAVSAHLFRRARDEAQAAAATDDHARLIRLIVQLGQAALVENVSWMILRRQRSIKPPSV